MRLEDILPDPAAQQKFVVRFWSKVAPPDEGGCRLWLGGKDRDGYGRIKITGRMFQAHRVAYMIEHGEVDDDLLVCHECDRPLCVTSQCLWQGTDADNVADMIRKGRRYTVFGELNPAVKLTEPDVLDIRRRYAVGNISQRALADEYDVSQHAINDIIRRKKWAHVPDEPEVVAKYVTGGVTQKRLAEEYEVSAPTISGILSGTTRSKAEKERIS